MPRDHAWWAFAVLRTTCPDKAIWELIHTPVRIHVNLLSSLDIVVIRELIRIDFQITYRASASPLTSFLILTIVQLARVFRVVSRVEALVAGRTRLKSRHLRGNDGLPLLLLARRRSVIVVFKIHNFLDFCLEES